MITRRTALAALAAPLVGCVHRAPVVAPPCVWGTPAWHPEPVLEPTESWEGRCAMPFSDGCWWDEARQRFRLWYMAGYQGGTALAESRDGYAWQKLGLVDPTPRDSSTVWQLADGTYARATYFLSGYSGDSVLTLQTSPDGLAWATVGRSPLVGDRSTVYQLADGRWVLSARTGSATRARAFWLADRFEGPYLDTGVMLAAEPVDDPAATEGPQLYNLDARAFGAGYLGLMSVWGGSRGADAPKRNNLSVVTSGDGLRWVRGPHLWIQEQPGAQNVQSCGGLFVRLAPGLLGFYVSARSGPVAAQRCVTGLVTVPVREVCV